MDFEQSKSVLLSIHSGAGGVDAQDWAQMLCRMYIRFCKNRSWKVKIIDQSLGKEAGVKNVVLEIKGEGAYKILKKEQGVHRLVRISPFDASHSRHTSFAQVEVLPEIQDSKIEIKPEDLKIDTFRSSGHGGQNVQKVETGVRITHLPTNIVVTCQTERSQYQNKMNALNLLKARIKQKILSSQEKQTINQRRSQIGQAKRAEKIRTYNFPQNRVTDHRINKSWHNLEEILQGELEDIIESLKKADTSNK